VASYPDLPPDPVARPWVVQRWEHLAFLHWPYPADRLQALLPFGLEVDTFDGMAWVALVPFRMVGVRPPFLPAPPWLTTFPETNVRTYVRGPMGAPGSGSPASRSPACSGWRSPAGLPGPVHVGPDGPRAP
jgi:uncharacterized protein